MSVEKPFRWIKIGGLLTLIPIVLAAAPMAGYLAGDWLVNRLHFPRFTATVCVIIGFAGGVRETVRIIKAALAAAKGAE